MIQATKGEDEEETVAAVVVPPSAPWIKVEKVHKKFSGGYRFILPELERTSLVQKDEKILQLIPKSIKQMMKEPIPVLRAQF